VRLDYQSTTSDLLMKQGRVRIQKTSYKKKAQPMAAQFRIIALSV
jgi:hypothetical protein